MRSMPDLPTGCCANACGPANATKSATAAATKIDLFVISFPPSADICGFFIWKLVAIACRVYRPAISQSYTTPQSPQMAGCGPSAKFFAPDKRRLVIGGTADSLFSPCALRILTPSGHWAGVRGCKHSAPQL